MNIVIDDKQIHINLDSEQIFLQDNTESHYPLITVVGTDQNDLEYVLLYETTEKYRQRANKIFEEIHPTIKLTWMFLTLYEQLTHEHYCNWENPINYRVIGEASH